MLQLAAVFGKIMIMMGVGFVLAKAGIMSEEMKKNVSTLLMKAVLPANILSCASQQFIRANAIGMIQVLLISMAYYLVSLLVLHIVMGKYKNSVKRNIMTNLAVFANVGFIGFPVLGEMLGEIGTLYTVAYNMAYQLFFFTYGIYLLSDGEKLTIRSLFQNKIIFVSMASIILYFLPFRFPIFLQETLASIGGMMIPLSLMIIGWEIAHTKLKELYSDITSYVVSGLRLILFPCIMAFVLKVLNVNSTVAIALVILTALPAGSLTVIAAQEQGKDTAFAARAVAQSTILMIVTLPIWLIVVNKLFA